MLLPHKEQPNKSQHTSMVNMTKSRPLHLRLNCVMFRLLELSFLLWFVSNVILLESVYGQESATSESSTIPNTDDASSSLSAPPSLVPQPNVASVVKEGVCSVADGTCPPPDVQPERALNLELGEDFGVIQDMDDDRNDEILEKIRTSRQYLQETVYTDSRYKAVWDTCRNQHSECAFWAVLGECQNNQAFMNVSCAPMCQTCEYVDFYTRCPLDSQIPNVWQPGDLNRMFERIVSDPNYQQRYEPVVLSRPSYVNGDTTNNATYQIGPWVITLEHVVSPEEAQRLIDLGAEEGYKQSADVGAMKFDGTFEEDVNEGRTSMNAWCGDACYADPMAKAVMNRIEDITQIPDTNTEFLQLLRYEVGQFYQTHHDYIEHDVDRQAGVRILTVFLYLNDVEAGGGTNFPKLNLTVYPKVGRALLWPSVLDDSPHAQDFRTDHQALPVERGIKYGANGWMHQRDFKTPYSKNCI